MVHYLHRFSDKALLLLPLPQMYTIVFECLPKLFLALPFSTIVSSLCRTRPASSMQNAHSHKESQASLSLATDHLQRLNFLCDQFPPACHRSNFVEMSPPQHMLIFEVFLPTKALD
ncbi:hypothetical protein M3J09_004399 [Ascochyta lentis]